MLLQVKVLDPVGKGTTSGRTNERKIGRVQEDYRSTKWTQLIPPL